MNLGASARGLSNQAHVVARQIAFSRPGEDVILQVNQTAAFKDLPPWHLPSMTGPSTPLKPRCCHKPTANYVWNWVLIELLQSMPQPNLFPPPPLLTLQPLLKRNSKASLARRVAPSINATRVCKTSQVTLFRCRNAHVHVHAVMLYWDPHNGRLLFYELEVSWGTKSSVNSWVNL